MFAREVPSAPFVALGGLSDYRYFEVPRLNFADFYLNDKFFGRMSWDISVILGLQADNPAILFDGLALDVPALHESLLVVFFDNKGEITQTVEEEYSTRTLACPIGASEVMLKIYLKAGVIVIDKTGLCWIEWDRVVS